MFRSVEKKFNLEKICKVIGATTEEVLEIIEVIDPKEAPKIEKLKSIIEEVKSIMNTDVKLECSSGP